MVEWGHDRNRPSDRYFSFVEVLEIRKFLLVTVCLVLVASVAILAILIRHAQLEAARMRTFGRLSQLRLALANYEAANGTLPRRQLKDKKGAAQFSWFVPFLPYMEEADLYAALDLTQPWDDPHNLAVAQSDPLLLEFLRGDGYIAYPLDAEGSLWNPHTGFPIGKLSEAPDSIALVAVPKNGIHPFQPLTVTIEQIRHFTLKGDPCYFIRSDGECGVVKQVNGEFEFALPSAPVRDIGG